MKILIFICMLGLFSGTLWSQTESSKQQRHPDAPPEAEQLEFFLGKWEVRGQDQSPDTPPGARTHAYYILDGTMIQDDFRALDSSGKVVWRGTSLRTYDSQKGKFSIKWLMAYSSGYTDITAEMKDGELVSTGKGVDSGGRAFRERFRYYEIQKDSFKFQMERSYDEGKTWRRFANSIFTRIE